MGLHGERSLYFSEVVFWIKTNMAQIAYFQILACWRITFNHFIWVYWNMHDFFLSQLWQDNTLELSKKILFGVGGDKTKTNCKNLTLQSLCSQVVIWLLFSLPPEIECRLPSTQLFPLPLLPDNFLQEKSTEASPETVEGGVWLRTIWREGALFRGCVKVFWSLPL